MIKRSKNKEAELLIGETIIFDWGNVLVFDPFDDLKELVADRAVELASTQYSVQLNREDFINAWSVANADAEFNFKFASHFSQEEPFIQYGLKKSGVAEEIRALLAPELLVIYRKAFKQLLINDPRKYDLRETLQVLKKHGKHLGVISNDRSFTPKSTLTWMGLSDLFDQFQTSEEVGIEKPDPRVFEVASRRFGKPIGDIIYVGDDPVRDVQCAHNAGAQAVLYVPPKKFQTSNSWRDYKNQPDKPDATVEKFSDLLKVIA